MKKLQTIIAVITCVFFTGCATFQANVETFLGSPSQVQADVTYAGARVKQYVSAGNQAKIHNFATQLSTTANLDLSALFALLPTTTGSWTADLVIANAKAVLTLVVNKWGSNNPTTLAYAHAVANGLLANF
jgi:hypothetical protein